MKGTQIQPQNLRRKLSFDTFEEILTEVDELLESGYEQAGNWSLGQICNHLAIFLRGSVEGFSFKLPAPIRFLLYHLIFKRILRDKKMATGVRVPKSFLPPEEKRDDAIEVANFKEALDAFMHHKGEYHKSPGFGKLTREEWHQLQLIHCAHHLSFLRIQK